jgi:hypothetical protein
VISATHQKRDCVKNIINETKVMRFKSQISSHCSPSNENPHRRESTLIKREREIERDDFAVDNLSKFYST